MATTIRGLDQLESKLKALARVTQRILLERAAKAGGLVIAERASQLAPVDSGRLADNQIVVVKRSLNTKDSVFVHIGPAKRAFYGLFQEEGTQFHVEQTFLGPAFEQSKDRALDTASDHLRDSVLKAAA